MKLNDMDAVTKEATISSWEQLFSVLFLVGLFSMNVYLIVKLDFYMIGIMEMLCGALLLFAAKAVRHKSKKNAAKEAARGAETKTD